jgi:dihydrolipoamide dehydrogenase
MGLTADLTIVGAGPAGYVAALRAAQLGARVVLVEKAELGGCCLNWGCIPTKALLRSVGVQQLAMRAREFGLSVADCRADFPRAKERAERAVRQLRSSLELLMRQKNITVVRGSARIAGGQQTMVALNEGGEQRIESRGIVVATGSKPLLPRIPGADGAGILTSDDVLVLEELPSSAVVVGAGPLGLEFGYILAAMGCKVAVLEMESHILPAEDEEMANELAKALRRKGLDIRCNARVVEIADGAAGKRVVYSSGDKAEGAEGPVPSDHPESDRRAATGPVPSAVEGSCVIMAVGRLPCGEGMGLEELGVEMRRATIKVNEKMQTGAAGIYAAGDVIGPPLLAHAASAEGKVAAANALGGDVVMSYKAVPACLYTMPEYASAGLTESAARRNSDIIVGRFPMRALGRAVAEGEREGAVKIVADAESHVILGAQILGPHASELIGEAALAIHLGATCEQVADAVHAHPTFSEAIMEAAGAAIGRALHA